MSITPVALISTLLAGIGAAFFVVGTIGLLRLPDLYTRLHALTKADNVGLGFVILALMPWMPDVFTALKLLLIWLLVLLAGATGAHLIAKRALHDGDEDPR